MVPPVALGSAVRIRVARRGSKSDPRQHVM
jgi:hypothetical protein